MLVERRPTPTGRTVVAKQAGTGDEAARLRHEAAVLEAARHPGVVEVLGLDGDPDRPVLLTSCVDGPTLAAAGELEADEVAGVLAAVAATVADLHELGVVHGGLVAEHVILGPQGAPVLCGFGDGGRIGDERAGGGEPLDGALDVFDLGRLTRSLCRPGSTDYRALRRLADEATAADPDDRPTARALAGAISAALPSARLPCPPASSPRAPTSPATPAASDPLDAWRRLQAPAPARLAPRRSWAVAGTVALVLGAVVAAAWLRSGTPAATPVPLEEPAGLHDDPTTAVAAGAGTQAATTTVAGGQREPAATSLPDPPATRADCPNVPSGLVADVDGDGCSDALRYAGGVLEGGAGRWSVGHAGDQLATGDWSCTGVRTLALLRPSTGEVFQFDRWAASGADVQAAAVARVGGAVALRAADLDHDGCHEMVVERTVGPPEVVRPPRVRP